MIAAPTLCNSLPKELRAIITDVNSVLRRIVRLIFLELYIGDELLLLLSVSCKVTEVMRL